MAGAGTRREPRESGAAVEGGSLDEGAEPIRPLCHPEAQAAAQAAHETLPSRQSRASESLQQSRPDPPPA